MNVTSVRNSGIPAPRPQDGPMAHEGARREADVPAQRAVRNAKASPAITAAGQGVLSDDEQRFFEDLYPGAVSELRSSPTYSRSGLQPGQGTGTLLDRKG